MTLRRVERRDLDEVWAITLEGMEGFREFAPEGWSPPDDEEALRAAFDDEGTWWLLAEAEDGTAAGHVLVRPSERTGWGGEPGLAHLTSLFVRRGSWGGGVATELLHRAVDRARERGFTRMRLFTPAEQARARRFYEREGWQAAGDPVANEHFGMPIVEYRRPLGSGPER